MTGTATWTGLLLGAEGLPLVTGNSMIVVHLAALDGEVDISSGSVRLDAGGWDHRLLISSETALDASKTVGVGAVCCLPKAGRRSSR